MLKFIVDAVLVIVVLVGLVMGLKRGFVGIVAKPVKFVASLALAFGLCSSVAKSLIVPYIGEPASNYVKDFLYANCSGITAETAAEELPTMLKIAAGMFDININEVASNAGGTVIDAIADKLTAPVIDVVAIVIAFIAVLILANIALSIVLAIINSIFKAGVLGAFNKILGVVFGIAFAVIIAWGLAVIFNLVLNIPAVSELDWVKNFADGGFIYKFLNEYNPIELLLSF